MSGSIIPTPAYKASEWYNFTTLVEKQRLGFISLSLTNYDNDSAPQIAAGSVVEISGSLFKFDSNDSIGGTPTSGQINYIMLEVSGSGDEQTVSGTWTTTAPSWNDAKQGWYDAGGNKRYAGGCYYDGTNYKLKFIYFDRDCGLEEQFIVPEMSHQSGTTSNQYGGITISNNGTGFLHVTLPHKAIVIELRIWTNGSLGTAGVQMRRGNLTDNNFVEMAKVTNTGADTSISYPEVDLENYFYWFRIDNTSGNVKTIYGMRVKVIKTIHRKERV